MGARDEGTVRWSGSRFFVKSVPNFSRGRTPLNVKITIINNIINRESVMYRFPFLVLETGVYEDSTSGVYRCTPGLFHEVESKE